MRTHIIYVWTGGRTGLVATVLGIIAIVAVFALALATGTPLIWAFLFAAVIVGCTEQFCRRDSGDLSLRQARQELNRIEEEGR